MRSPVHGDAVSVARVLLSVPLARREWVLARIFREAEMAHAQVLEGLGGHPFWGDGSLMTAALRRNAVPEPSLRDVEYCRCLSVVYARISYRVASAG